MREIILDTETTGFDPYSGDRVVEIGCVEIHNLVPTGEHFQRYINPERGMPESAFRIHGLSSDFLAGHPVFEEHADDLLAFIADANIIAHNADFDLKFLNFELENVGRASIARSRVIDTLAIAREKYPGAQNSLDALCRRFGINNAHRTLHGALLDSEILAEVYLELKGGRQAGFELDAAAAGTSATTQQAGRGDNAGQVGAGDQAGTPGRPKRDFPPRSDELANHSVFLDQLTDPIWRR